MNNIVIELIKFTCFAFVSAGHVAPSNFALLGQFAWHTSGKAHPTLLKNLLGYQR